ncbi:NAD(P)H dehydrogenase (quinone) FQR1-like [Primulina eburnea]|uniref:NAD(P)H dehydrogenase (quinone) FQR1-like n=1 Tax=Primulina eburnea TaxID=1245227 RepID=UPI003C6BFAE5
MATKLYIVYYSMYGHVEKLAREIKKGADTVEGVEAKLYQVAETLPDEVLGKMYAPPKSADVPVITANELVEADGLIFGMPTRFGMMPAQLKALLDATGRLWQTGALVGKPVGMFTSTSSQGSGHETTALTAITQFAHHGMIIVPTGYTFGEGMYVLDEIKGGSAYGAGTFTGRDGSRQPSELELAHAFHQGKYIAGVVKKFKGGSA